MRIAPQTALILAAIVMLGAGLLIFRGMFTPGAFTQQALPKVTPGASVVGTPWEWRVLDTRHFATVKPATMKAALENSGMLGGLVPGNFDRDPDTEVALTGAAHSAVYNASGEKVPIKLHGRGFSMSLTAWDENGDGIDEIVPEAISYNVAVNYKPGQKSSSALPTTTPVFRLDGTQVATLKGIASLGTAIGDLDGDGFDELGLNDNGSLVVHSKGGLMITYGSRRASYPVAFADPFNAGRDSVIISENRGRALHALDAQGKTTSIGNVSFVALQARPYDLDGDGRDELIFDAEGYLNPASGFVHFKTRVSTMPVVKTAVGDFLRTGAPQVATLQGQSIPANELVIFDLAGQVVHHETFPSGNQNASDGTWDLATLTSSRQDFLCLQLSQQLLIYP
jgi:hypothetical protein